MYRWGVIYAEGNIYYLDFGDFHVWGHAALSFAAFGALSLFSASVSQCLFPKVRPWIFVFAQITLLVISCFIAMFWIDDPTLSIGLMIVPEADTHYTQTPNNSNPAGGAVSTTNLDVGTSTTNLIRASPDVPPHLPLTSMQNTTTPTTASANLQLSNNVLMNAALSSSSPSTSSGSTVLGGYGYNHVAGVSRMSLQTKQGPIMSSVVEKQDLDHDQENQQYFDREKQEVADEATAMVPSEPSSESTSASEKEQYVSVKMN
ncbi:hypothetical protein BG011_006259 [Mortierella polycephala]|uniref:Uncharacterized protein n=1 Tax=Mortierella polycephala TaxID=41804 RepID=A0A9P6PVI3_9FUNG|nr:hypothetical protein BG011_006259 [Mortierella polycephala]